MHRSVKGLQNLVGSLLNSGNASKSLLSQGGTGGLSMVSRLGLRIGANIRKLEVSEERLNNQIFLSEVGLSRLTSDVLVDESNRLAKEQIRLQSSQALLTQTFSISENILNTLLLNFAYLRKLSFPINLFQ